MYIERIKPYEYLLECGMVFRSYTPSTPDEFGLHNFPCFRCKDWHSYTDVQKPTLRMAPGSARDMINAIRYDKAILKDRIVKDLLLLWDGANYKTIAARHGVGYITVFRIAAELGVSDNAKARANV